MTTAPINFYERVEHGVHNEVMRRALGQAGFAITDLREPRIDERLQRAFRRAGRSDFERMRGLPVLQLYRACRGGS